MSLSVQDVERWFGKQPEINDQKKDQILKGMRLEVDAEGFITSGAATRIMGEKMASQMFEDLFDRKNY